MNSKNDKWYSFKEKTTWDEFRRNLSLTFSLSYIHREGKIPAYLNWYEDTVEKLAQSNDYSRKNLALHLIIHTGTKERDYAIAHNSRLWKIAHTLYVQNKLKKTCNSGTPEIFYRKNFPKLFQHPHSTHIDSN